MLWPAQTSCRQPDYPASTWCVPLPVLVPGADLLYLLDLEQVGEEYLALNDWRDRLDLSTKGSVGFAAPGGEFTRSVYQLACRPESPFPPSLLAGKTVVEIGAGMAPYGYLLANTLGAAGYVGVEPFYADCLARSIAAVIQQASLLNPTPYAVLAEDMVSSLRRMPDRSVGIFAFGIERCILSGEGYLQTVEQEIARVLSVDTPFISLRSDIHLAGKCDTEISFFTTRKGMLEYGSARWLEGKATKS